MKRFLLLLLLPAIVQAQMYPLGNGVSTLQIPYNNGTSWSGLGVSGSGNVALTADPSISGLTLSDITGSVQCVHASSAGLLTGTGGDCGAALPIATITKTSQTATIAETILCASTTCNVAGAQYQVAWNIWGSGTACSSVTAGQVTFTLYWTDEQGTAHNGVIMLMNTQTSATAISAAAYFHFETSLANEGSSGVFVISTNGAAAIQFGNVYTACTTGTGTYNERLTVTRVQ